LITRRDEPVRLSSSGVPFAGLQPVPGGRNWAAIQPRSKRMTRLRLAYSALELSRGQCRLTLWGTLDARAEPTWPARPFRRSQLCTLCWPALLRRPLAVLSTRPQRRRVAGRIQRSELLPSRDACGLSNRARRTPRSWRGCLRDGRQRWVGAFRRRGPLFPESGLCSHRCGPWLWIRFSTRSAGVSMDAK